MWTSNLHGARGSWDDAGAEHVEEEERLFGEGCTQLCLGVTCAELGARGTQFLEHCLIHKLKWLRYSWLLPRPRSECGCVTGWTGTAEGGTETVGAGRDLLELLLMLENPEPLRALGMDVWQPPPGGFVCMKLQLQRDSRSWP